VRLEQRQTLDRVILDHAPQAGRQAFSDVATIGGLKQAQRSASVPRPSPSAASRSANGTRVHARDDTNARTRFRCRESAEVVVAAAATRAQHAVGSQGRHETIEAVRETASEMSLDVARQRASRVENV
jgi:hypothetical protein